MVRRVSKGLVFGVFLCVIPAVNRMAAQDLTYTYDDAGNLNTVKKIDFQNDPFNCGSFGNECSGGAGKCQMGRCVAPPCPPGGCVGVPPKQPLKVKVYCMTGHCGIPDQPKLVSGGLHGHRVCGPFPPGSNPSFSFDCASPLPSNSDSGWQLTPEAVVNPDGKSHPNKAVVLNISTPTQTELFVEFENQSGNPVEQAQVTRQAGDAEVADVGAHGQVAEVMSDDGHTRTWTLQFLLNTCTDVAKLNIFSVGSSGITNGVRSSPLHVWLLRDPAEIAALSGCS
jgi:hypothetical protein